MDPSPHCPEKHGVHDYVFYDPVNNELLSSYKHFGGPYRDRTGRLHIANVALYQMS